jgi:predicted tellurium resistance membrane protein TerC
MILAAVVLFEVILLEFILGLSNVWFSNFLGENLPHASKEKASFLGLFFAWAIRILVLIFFQCIA